MSLWGTRSHLNHYNSLDSFFLRQGWPRPVSQRDQCGRYHAFHATLQNHRPILGPPDQEELVETERAAVIGDAIAMAAINIVIISVVILGTLIGSWVGKFQQVSK